MKDTDTDTDLKEAMQGLRPATAPKALPATPAATPLPAAMAPPDTPSPAAKPKKPGKKPGKSPKAAAAAKPGKPSKPGPKPKPKPQPKAAGPAQSKVLVPEILDDENSENGISSENGIEDDKRYNDGVPRFCFKSPLTEQELVFVELYLSGGYTHENAMIEAGYKDKHPKNLYRLGKRIIEKYETQAGDHRKIMRAMGYG